MTSAQSHRGWFVGTGLTENLEGVGGRSQKAPTEMIRMLKMREGMWENSHIFERVL